MAISNGNDDANLIPANFAVLRTPLLPFEVFLDWGNAQTPGGISGLRDALRDIVSRPEVREALFVASPDLHESMGHWLADPESKRGQRIERSLIRYLARMTGRATPFGLFAGVSVARVTSGTSLNGGHSSQGSRKARLDMDYLGRVVDWVVERPTIREHLTCRVNSSLYDAGEQLRYIERSHRNSGISFSLVGISATPYLRTAVERARDGATIDDLARAITSRDISLPEARTFALELVANQVVVPTLAPPVTGDISALESIIDELSAMPGAGEILPQLRQFLEVIGRIERAPLGCCSSHYEDLKQCAQQIPVPFEPNRLLQVDLFKPDAAATIGADIVQEIRRGVQIFHRVAKPPAVSGPHKKFAAKFLERYGDAEVSLLEVLDDDLGLGFDRSLQPAADGSPLLRDMAFPTADKDVLWTQRDAFLLKKLASIRDGTIEIVLDEREVNELADLTPEPLPLARSFSANVAIAASSADEISKGNYRIHLIGVFGPSAATFLGRFCHGRKDLADLVRHHIKDEESLSPEAVFAEILHIPEDRVGNVVCRPVLRDYEIPYLARSGVPREHQIPVQDLFLTVRSERVVLLSRRLGREIIPRLSSAHFAFAQRNLPVYKFLATLQLQGVSAHVWWHWGPLADAPFLPRVSTGRFVLSLAQWNLGRDQIASLAGQTRAQRLAAVAALRVRLQLPRIVAVADQDNRLPVDLENPLSIDALVHLVKNRNALQLVEMFPDHDELAVKGPEGRFVHEIVLPFLRNSSRESQDLPRHHNAARRSDILRLPGSEWLYVKVYTGHATSDSILINAVAPCVQKAIGEGSCKRWFFIRYADPDYHLRLRFDGDSVQLLNTLFPALRDALGPWTRTGSVWKTQIDTYQREVNRYGGPEAIGVAETIFHIDSDAVISLLHDLLRSDRADARWLLALKGADLFLDAFGFQGEEKKSIATNVLTGLWKEFAADRKGLRVQLATLYRRHCPAMVELFGNVNEPMDGALAAGIAILRKRSAALREPISRIHALSHEGRLSVGIQEIAVSQVHMFLNRLLPSSHRAHEFIMYDFLVRQYRSKSARAASTSSHKDEEV